ncbi:MAG TPA: MFS transporter [Myxococcota bacterium]|nr:MFS transporter [Myxococcota bacterium]
MPGDDSREGSLRWLVLASVVGMNFVATGMAWTYVVVLVAPILEDLHLQLLDWGKLWSGLSMGALLGAVPAGVLGDRFGVRGVVTAGALAMAATLGLRALGGSFGVVLVAMVLYGVTLSLVSANLPKALGMWFPPQQLGLVNGIALAGNGGGQGLATFAAPLALGWAGGWRGLTAWLALGVTALAVIWGVCVRERGPRPEPGDTPAGAGIGSALGVPAVWLVAGSYFFFLAGYLGVVSYLPSYLVSARGLAPQAAGGMLSIVLASYVLGSLIFPGLSDRIGLRKAVYVPGILLSGAMVYCSSAFTGSTLVAVMVVWGLAAGAIALVFTVPLELPEIGPELAGSAIGATLMAGFAGGFISPIVGLALAERSPSAAFLFWAGCYALSALAFAFLPETGSARRYGGAR